MSNASNPLGADQGSAIIASGCDADTSGIHQTFTTLAWQMLAKAIGLVGALRFGNERQAHDQLRNGRDRLCFGASAHRHCEPSRSELQRRQP